MVKQLERWKLPNFVSGVRVVPYYAGHDRKAWRIDIGRPGNGLDVTDERDLLAAIGSAKRMFTQ